MDMDFEIINGTEYGIKKRLYVRQKREIELFEWYGMPTTKA
jgi:hypothetical protein